MTFFLKFLARSCKIVHILGALGKNLAKILTKGFKNMQDSWQEFQDILHWAMTRKFFRNPWFVFYFYVVFGTSKTWVNKKLFETRCQWQWHLGLIFLTSRENIVIWSCYDHGKSWDCHNRGMIYTTSAICGRSTMAHHTDTPVDFRSQALTIISAVLSRTWENWLIANYPMHFCKWLFICKIKVVNFSPS